MGMIKLIDSLKNAGNGNFKVEILNEPIQVRKMMLDGTADFAILPGTMAAITYNKGMGYQLIAVPVWGTLYLLGEDPAIQNWGGLKGKKIYLMARGMTPDVLFRHLLKENGISPETDVELDYSFPTHIDLANAIAAGQAKMGVVSEPFVSLLLQKDNNLHSIFDLNAEWEKIMGTPMFGTAFMGKESLLRQNREAAVQIIAAYEKSTQWVNNNPEKAAGLIVKHGILPDYKAALQAIPRSNLKFVRANGIGAQINAYLSVFYEMDPDIVGGKIPDENFIYK